MLQDYKWKYSRCGINTHTIHSLHISTEREMKEISHLSADQIRILVGFLINLYKTMNNL